MRHPFKSYSTKNVGLFATAAFLAFAAFISFSLLSLGCTIGLAPPVVENAPACISATSVELHGTKAANKGVSIRVFLNDAQIQSYSLPIDASTVWSQVISFPGEGIYVLKLNSTSASSSLSQELLITLAVDFTPPTVTAHDLPGGGTVDMPLVRVLYRVEDNAPIDLQNFLENYSAMNQANQAVPVRSSVISQSGNELEFGVTIELVPGANEIVLKTPYACGEGSALVTYTPVDAVLTQTGKDKRNEWLSENALYFTEANGIHAATGFPADVIGPNAPAGVKWSQPTSIAFYLHILGNIISKRFTCEALDEISAIEKAEHALDQLIAFRDQFGWNGFVPWVKLEGAPQDCPSGFPCQDNPMIGLIDNANLAHHLAALMGLFEKSNLYLDSEIAPLYQKAQDYLDAMKPGFEAFQRPESGVFRSAYNTSTQSFDIWGADRFGSEVRASVPFLITYFNLNPGAWSRMFLSTSTCPNCNSGNLKTFSAFDGGAFQYFWPLLAAPEQELPHISTALQNAFQIFSERSSASGVLGFPSAASLPTGGYSIEVGHNFLKETHVTLDETLGTVYGLASAYVLNPSSVMSMLQNIESTYPDLSGPLGFYDSVRTGGAISHNYYGIDQGSLVLGLLGTGGSDFKYFMDRRNLFSAYQDFYAGLTLDLNVDPDSENFYDGNRYRYNDSHGNGISVVFGNGVFQYAAEVPGSGWIGGFVVPEFNCDLYDSVAIVARSVSGNQTVRFEVKYYGFFFVSNQLNLTPEWQTFRFKLRRIVTPQPVNFIAFADPTGDFEVQSIYLSDFPDA